MALKGNEIWPNLKWEYEFMVICKCKCYLVHKLRTAVMFQVEWVLRKEWLKDTVKIRLNRKGSQGRRE